MYAKHMKVGAITARRSGCERAAACRLPGGFLHRRALEHRPRRLLYSITHKALGEIFKMATFEFYIKAGYYFL